MGQQEVYNILKEEKERWLTAREIADRLNRPFGRVVVNLSRLRRSDAILHRQIERIVKPAGKRTVLIYRYNGKSVKK